MLMGDEKDTWKVKTLDEILLEKKRRRELEERTDPKRPKNVKYTKTHNQLKLYNTFMLMLCKNNSCSFHIFIVYQRLFYEYFVLLTTNPACIVFHSSPRALFHRRMIGKLNETLRRKENYGIREWK